VLAGFALALFFGLANGLIRSGLIPVQSQRSGYRLLQRILLYGFMLALAIVVLGFGLKYRELSRGEQAAAARLILAELKADRGVAGSLAANSATALQDSATLAYVLRSKASPLLHLLLPYRNIQPDDQTAAPAQMAHQQLAAAIVGGLPERQIELDRMNAVANAVRGTLGRTRVALQSLADLDGSRYRMSRAAWNANLPVLRRVSAIDLTQLEGTYSNLEQARANYAVLMQYDLTYVGAADRFLAFNKHELTEEELAQFLAAERQYFAVATAYSSSIVNEISAAGQSIDKLDASLRSPAA
jgi:hypothetical protein